MQFLGSALILIMVSLGLVGLIHRNLRQRDDARMHRKKFISIADDLISKAELPDAAARFLVTLASVPGGWLTRAMAWMVIREIFTGQRVRNKDPIRLETIPEHLRVKFVVAILSIALSDSYRCALLGRIWRGANPWVLDAIGDPKPDANAHATRHVVEQASAVHVPRQIKAAEARLAALAA